MTRSCAMLTSRLLQCRAGRLRAGGAGWRAAGVARCAACGCVCCLCAPCMRSACFRSPQLGAAGAACCRRGCGAPRRAAGGSAAVRRAAQRRHARCTASAAAAAVAGGSAGQPRCAARAGRQPRSVRPARLHALPARRVSSRAGSDALRRPAARCARSARATAPWCACRWRWWRRRRLRSAARASSSSLQRSLQQPPRCASHSQSPRRRLHHLTPPRRRRLRWTGGCSQGGRCGACCTTPLRSPPATGSGERGTARAAQSYKRGACAFIASRYEKSARKGSSSPREPRTRSTCAALVPLRCKLSARPAPGNHPARSVRHSQRAARRSVRGARLSRQKLSFDPVQQPHAAALRALQPWPRIVASWCPARSAGSASSRATVRGEAEGAAGHVSGLCLGLTPRRAGFITRTDGGGDVFVHQVRPARRRQGGARRRERAVAVGQLAGRWF